jgi:DNA-binding transcriptional ArsR family regulator
MVEDQALDRTYGALADPTRRAILVALQDGAARVGDLAEPFPVSLAAVSRHIGVLHSAGLIQREVRGREHWVSVRLQALRDAEQWISRQTRFWEQRADALAARFEGQDHLR